MIFFAATTFLVKYSMKQDNKPVELPSCMYKRVASTLAKNKEEEELFLKELYAKRMNFATPIYTNIGIPSRGGAISCNLTHIKEDSIEGIEETLTKIAYASKEGAGIGLLIDPIRSQESYVSSFSGKAGGIVRLADMVQSKMRFYKQGSRSGSCALYLSLWHRDIMDFLKLTLPIGEEKLRARDLFTAVVVNDLFMNKLLNGEKWHLFCPNDIKLAGLRPFQDLWGEEFEKEYQKAVDLGIGHEINPKEIWDAIITSQTESGKPYVMFKDNANKRNMQDNIGVIKQSNLCIEVFQASKPEYTPQCTLGSINLAEHDGIDTIYESVKVMVRALNRVLDVNKWSDEWSKSAGLDQRALAIGVAGLADFFAKKKISFESAEAKKWNDLIFSTMYKAAIDESARMANEEGRVYPSWEGSLYSKGETYIPDFKPHGGEPIPVLNSLFIGLMPTASSAILLGVFESFEPVNSNLFTRRVGQGEFVVINKYLVQELDELGLWDDEMRDALIRNSGSVQGINRVPEDIQHRYKEVYEIPQKNTIGFGSYSSKIC
jgi:ribonucleoside-diphosphate reductase alpha subunit